MVCRNTVFLAVFVVAVLPFTISKVVANNGHEGFTFLGSRESYSNLTKEFHQSNYYLSAGSGTWSESSDDCLKTFGRKGHLVSIETLEEQVSINNWIFGAVSYWTSGFYDVTESKWIWEGNPDYEFSHYENWWNNTQPEKPTEFDRIILSSAMGYENKFKWVTTDERNSNRYICEMDSESNVGTDAPMTAMA